MNKTLEILYKKGWKETSRSKGQLIGKCPCEWRHSNGEDKNPSFSVNEESGAFNCFACGLKGKSVVTLLMNTDNLTKQEAIKLLNPNSYINKEDFFLEEIQSEFIKLRKKEKRQKSFEKYIESRNLPIKALSDFRIGYASGTIYRVMAEKYPASDFQKEKILSEDGSWWLGKRITIPIYSGNVLVGWTMRSAEQNPDRKYVNIHSERYGTSWMFGKSIPSKQVYIVEGAFDAISMYYYGYNTVASLGTNITDERMITLAKYEEIVLMLDGDKAGLTAMQTFFFRHNHHAPNSIISIVEIPKGKDPNTMTKSEVDTAVSEKKQAFDWVLERTLTGTPDEQNAKLSKLKAKVKQMKQPEIYLAKIQNVLESHTFPNINRVLNALVDKVGTHAYVKAKGNTILIGNRQYKFDNDGFLIEEKKISDVWKHTLGGEEPQIKE